MVDSTHLLNLGTTRTEGAPYLDFTWLWKGSDKGPNHTEHTQDWGEAFGFVGRQGLSLDYEVKGLQRLF